MSMGTISEDGLVECHDVCLLLDAKARCESGNNLELLNSGEEFVPAMLASINTARSSVDLELYRVDPGHLWRMFSNALAGAAERQVHVRVLVDSFGSRRMMETDWRDVLRSGVDVRLTTSVVRSLLTKGTTRRDHRKILVVDSEVGFTGGMSIDDTFFRPSNESTWRESMVKVRGPVAATMQHVFDAAWCDADEGGPMSTAPFLTCRAGSSRARLILSTPRQPCGEELFVSAIRGASISAWITNPFVVPSKDISASLTSAARRSVDVRLLVPGRFHRFPMVRYAMRGFYDLFLSAGVRVFEYEAAMLHAKTIVVDGRWASVGSFNLDPRSFASNDEAAIAACDCQFAKAVAAAFANDCESAQEVFLARWRERGFVSRFSEAAVQLLRSYL